MTVACFAGGEAVIPNETKWNEESLLPCHYHIVPHFIGVRSQNDKNLSCLVKVGTLLQF